MNSLCVSAGASWIWLSGSSVSPHHGLFEIVWFDATNEIRLTQGQCFHQRIQRLAELTGQSWNTFLPVGPLLSDKNKDHVCNLI